MDYLKCCQVCYNVYNNEDHAPYVISPCGHTFCLECINKLSPNLCPVDRIIIQNKILNRYALDSLSKSTIKPESSLIHLKKSLVQELKGIGKEIFNKKLDVINNLTTNMKTQINEEKTKKMKILESDTKNLLESLEETYKKLISQSQIEIKDELFAAVVNAHQKNMLTKAKTSKEAVDASDDIKKKIWHKLKTLEDFIIQFHPSQSFSENSIGKITWKKTQLNKKDYIGLFSFDISQLASNDLVEPAGRNILTNSTGDMFVSISKKELEEMNIRFQYNLKTLNKRQAEDLSDGLSNSKRKHLNLDQNQLLSKRIKYNKNDNLDSNISNLSGNGIELGFNSVASGISRQNEETPLFKHPKTEDISNRNKNSNAVVNAFLSNEAQADLKDLTNE